MIDIRELYRSESAYIKSMQQYDENVASWTVQPQSLYVDTRFGKTHVLRVGESSKPPFLFFHGWSGNASGTHSELDIARLAQYFCLYFPDTIGQSGKSAPSRPPTDDDSYSLWGTDILSALDLHDVYLSGISGGGYLALKTASLTSEKVKKIFLIVPGGFVDLSRINLRFILSVMPAAMGFEWGGRYFIRRMVSPNFDDEVKIDEMGKGMKDILSGLKPVNGPKPLSDEELKSISCPAYVIVGQHDIAVNPKQTIQRAHQNLLNVKTVMTDAGHMITLEKWDWLMDEMLAFFEVEHG